MAKTVSITQTTNGKLPRLPFEHIKDRVLGKTYELSLVFAGSRRMQTLNKTYRSKSYIPNVLTFPLDKTHGEIFINPSRVAVEAKRFDLSERGYTAFLFIHGLFHLKGLQHGATMEQKERQLLRMFNIR